MTVDLVRNLLQPHGFKKIFEKKLDASESHEGRDGKSKMVLWSRVGKDIDANNNGSDL